MSKEERQIDLERQKLSLISRLSHTDEETLTRMVEILAKLDVTAE